MKTVILAAVAVLTSTAASAGVLYSQPWDGGANILGSQNDTNSGGLGNFTTVYDNFTLAGGGQITSVDWTGGYFNPPSQGPITQWTVSIYGDSAGQPGALLYQETVPGAGGETFNSTVSGFPIYNYDVAANFTAAAGTQYWLSVVPDLGFPPQWGWATGTGGDGVGYQDFFGTLSNTGTDFSFTLVGGTVPEPATWALMLAGFAGFGVALRSRRARSAAA
ncbi:MAG TPA: PEPxxWA-CTERM sorting domain-containing protein [Caulobacteraceae bacterium]